MGLGSANSNKKLQNVKVTEAFEDGDMDYFNAMLASIDIDLKAMCLMRDHDKRTPLHLVCMKGHLEMFERLLPIYVEHKVDLDVLDENGDTPLLLSCSHGYTNEVCDEVNVNFGDVGLDENIKANQRRFKIVAKLLKSGANIKKSIGKRKNNPLHWAVYHGDYETGMAIFNEYPLIILKKNNNRFVPLEIVFQGNLKRYLAESANKLVKQIIEKFSMALFHNDDNLILKNAGEKEIEMFKALKNLRTSAKAYDTNELLARLSKLRKISMRAQGTLPLNFDPESLNNEEIKEDKAMYQTEEQRPLKPSFPIQLHSNKVANIHLPKNEEEEAPDSLRDTQDDQNVVNDKQKEVMIYDETQRSVLNDSYLVFMHKLLLFAVHVEDINVIRLLIDSFMLSPFVPTVNGYTALHYACTRKSTKVVEILLNYNYKYYDSDREFNIVKQINRGVTEDYNTCAHFAVKHGNIETFELLYSHGASMFKFNYQDWKPLDMSKRSYFLQREEKIMEELESAKLSSFDDLLKLDSLNPKKLSIVNEECQYILIAKDTESDYTNTLVYKQLELIRNTYMDKLKVKYVKPMNHEMKDHYRFYFLIYVEDELLDIIADYLNLSIYNAKKDYVTLFSVNSSNQFTKFRDYHVHTIVKFLLNTEFHLDYYIKEGIVEAAFPLHEFITRKNISKNWQQERLSVFFDPWKPKRTTKDLRPFNSMAFYFGCDIALYVSFIIQYTSYLLFLALIGGVIYIWILITSTALDNFLTPIFAFLISLWATFTYEKWRVREAEHAFIWNTNDYKLNEQPRVDYKGIYVIDPVSKNIVQEDPFPTYKRRYVVS